MAKIKSVAVAALVVAFIAMVVGFGIGTTDLMPDYAPVYLDDLAHTYLALPCLEERQRRQGQSMAALRLGRASEAHSLNYAADEICVESGAFSMMAALPAVSFLSDLGFFRRPNIWWDKPYRTEEGVVVRPQ